MKVHRTRRDGRVSQIYGGSDRPRFAKARETGPWQIFELVTQRRGEAGPRQVDGTRIAAHKNSAGLRGIEEAAVVINVLKA